MLDIYLWFTRANQSHELSIDRIAGARSNASAALPRPYTSETTVSSILALLTSRLPNGQLAATAVTVTVLQPSISGQWSNASVRAAEDWWRGAASAPIKVLWLAGGGRPE